MSVDYNYSEEEIMQRFPILYDRICGLFPGEERNSILELLSRVTEDEEILLYATAGREIPFIDNFLQKYLAECNNKDFYILSGVIMSYHDEIRNTMILGESQIKAIGHEGALEYIRIKSQKSNESTSPDTAKSLDIP